MHKSKKKNRHLTVSKVTQLLHFGSDILLSLSCQNTCCNKVLAIGRITIIIALLYRPITYCYGNTGRSYAYSEHTLFNYSSSYRSRNSQHEPSCSEHTLHSKFSRSSGYIFQLDACRC